MKRLIFVLLILGFVVSLMGQKKEIEIKKTSESYTKDILLIKKGKPAYTFTPKSIEEIINAGEQLRGYRNNTYKNMLVGFLGGIFMSIGTNSDSSENNFLFFAGSVTVIYAGIAQIININKIGKAGEHLERSVRVKKSVKAK